MVVPVGEAGADRALKPGDGRTVRFNGLQHCLRCGVVRPARLSSTFPHKRLGLPAERHVRCRRRRRRGGPWGRFVVRAVTVGQTSQRKRGTAGRKRVLRPRWSRWR